MLRSRRSLEIGRHPTRKPCLDCAWHTGQMLKTGSNTLSSGSIGHALPPQTTFRSPSAPLALNSRSLRHQIRSFAAIVYPLYSCLEM